MGTAMGENGVAAMHGKPIFALVRPTDAIMALICIDICPYAELGEECVHLASAHFAARTVCLSVCTIMRNCCYSLPQLKVIYYRVYKPAMVL
jgi:hypothetical protein